MTKQRTLRKFPQLHDGVKYCVVFYEGQHNDSRTNVALALTAADHGAAVANHAEVVGMIREFEGGGGGSGSGRVVGVRVRDRLAPSGGGTSGKEEQEEDAAAAAGATMDVRGKVVMFCGGPFTDELRDIEHESGGHDGGGVGVGVGEGKKDGGHRPEPGASLPPLERIERAVKGASGIHVVLPGYFAPSGIGMVDMATSDGRFLFFLPWLGHTVVGTTDTPVVGTPSMTPEPSE